MQTRRTFLSISAATVAGAVITRHAPAQSAGGELFTPATLGAYQQNLLSKGGMEKMVGSLFMVFLDNGKVAYLTLGSVLDLADLQPVATTQTPTVKQLRTVVAQKVLRASGFVAIFNGDTKMVPQGTYVVDHGRLGRTAMLLVPSRNLAGQTTVVATFTTL